MRLTRPISFVFSTTQSIFAAMLVTVVCALLAFAWWQSDERSEWAAHERYSISGARVEQFLISYANSDEKRRIQLSEFVNRNNFYIRRASPADSLTIAPDSPLASALEISLAPDFTINSSWLTQCHLLPIRKLYRSQSESAFSWQQEQCEGLLVTFNQGDVIHLSVPIDSWQTSQTQSHLPYQFSQRVLVFAGVLLLALIFIAYFIARAAVRPVRQLAVAAKALGENLHLPALPIKGPHEVRVALKAFNRMQTTLQKQVQGKAQMLAAITHDLQTPLTRLRLRLEQINDESIREQLINDLINTQKIVTEGLQWASSQAELSQHKINLGNLLQAIQFDYSAKGQSINADGETAKEIWVLANTTGLRRVLQNLLDNAFQYGSEPEIEVVQSGSDVWVIVSNQGEGIPAAEAEKVFEPYYRLESSRSRVTGGSGLGLSIARNLMSAMGGQIKVIDPASHEQISGKLQTIDKTQTARCRIGLTLRRADT